MKYDVSRRCNRASLNLVRCQMSLSLRTHRVLLYAALLFASVQAISNTAPVERSAKQRPTICELMVDPTTYAGHFVFLSGRLVKQAGDFALIDDACLNTVVVLKNSGPLDVLGLTCKPKEPLFGLTCLMGSTTDAIIITASGMVSPADKSKGQPFLSVWEVSNVSVVPAPKRRGDHVLDAP
jgi:hypothetical protein